MIAGHDPSLQRRLILRRQDLRGNRKDDPVLPRDMSALTIEVATHDVAKHFGIDDGPGFSGGLQGVAEFNQDCTVTLMLFFEAGQCGAQWIVFGDSFPQHGKEGLLL